MATENSLDCRSTGWNLLQKYLELNRQMYKTIRLYFSEMRTARFFHNYGLRVTVWHDGFQATGLKLPHPRVLAHSNVFP